MRTVYTSSSSIFFQAVLTGSQFIISNYIVILSLKIDFALAKSADPDEMLHHAAFNLGLHGLQKYH